MLTTDSSWTSLPLRVARFCLMLADFPNHNGWKLIPENVFRSPSFVPAVRSCNVVLSNPPFGDFTPKDRARYEGLKSFHKPAEFLDRVLKYLPQNGMVGLVLPHKFLDGRGYREIRENLFRRFASVESVALPDGIFEQSEAESALVIATDARRNGTGRLSVSFTEVAQKDRQKFLDEYAYTRNDEATLTLQERQRKASVLLCFRKHGVDLPTIQSWENQRIFIEVSNGIPLFLKIATSPMSRNTVF